MHYPTRFLYYMMSLNDRWHQCDRN